MEKYEKYLEPQKEAEFIRKLPTTMLSFNTSGYSSSTVGLLQGDKSTDTELVYLNARGTYTVKYTGKSLTPEKVIVEQICQAPQLLEIGKVFISKLTKALFHIFADNLK